MGKNGATGPDASAVSIYLLHVNYRNVIKSQ